jgi:fused signal recognition particle receptor
MQTPIIISLIVLGSIALIIAIDLYRARQNRSKPEKVEQIPHQPRTSSPAVESKQVIETEAPAKDLTPVQEVTPKPHVTVVEEQREAALEKVPVNFFARIKSGLSRTRHQFTDGLSQLFSGRKQIDEELLEEIETQLLTADVGIAATSSIIESITEKYERNELKNAESLHKALRTELSNLLKTCHRPLEIDVAKRPYVILVVGVNGVGKTTTIGKMAKRFQTQGHSVMLAAGDTFRAAAVEQLQVWGERNNVPVVAQHTGADSASVIYDAIASAKAKGVDILIADTAGRLQNKDNLMNELEKVVRVMQKIDNSAPHEVMLVLDAGTGQNALSQAQAFQKAVGVTGISLTKLDGTAKGGIIFAIAKQLQMPIRFIGVGEQIDDLRPFEADEFVAALFD